MELTKGEDMLLLLKTEKRHVCRERPVMRILICELFEALHVKGLTAVIAIFFVESMHYKENMASELVHLYLMVCALSNSMGAVISEILMGHYKATLFFFNVQLSGLVLLTITTITVIPWQDVPVLMALLLVALGFAASPSFITFGCHQAERNFKAGGNLEWENSGTELITKSQNIPSQQFISTFYQTMKVGFAAGAVISPDIRVLGGGSFFFVFLMCASVKSLAILTFWSGKKQYYFEKPQSGSGEGQERLLDPKESQYSSTVYSCTNSLGNGLEEASQPAEESSWENWKTLSSLLLVLMPVALFVALDYQTVSTWVFQGRKMNGKVSWLGNYTIPPDQMLVFNHLLCFVTVPALDMVIYPFMEHRVLRLTNLRKITGSIFCATLSFLMSGVLQIAINRELERHPASFAENISILWQLPQYVAMEFGVTMMFIPSMHFAYREAPDSMKSAVIGVLQTVCGIGNAFTIAVLAILGPNASKVETMFVFAFVGAVGTLIMAFCSEMYVSRHN